MIFKSRRKKKKKNTRFTSAHFRGVQAPIWMLATLFFLFLAPFQNHQQKNRPKAGPDMCYYANMVRCDFISQKRVRDAKHCSIILHRGLQGRIHLHRLEF